MNESLDQKPGCMGFLQKLFGSPGGGGVAGPWPYQRRKYLLSRAEFSFYRVLQQACGDRFVVCPKIRLADLLMVRMAELFPDDGSEPMMISDHYPVAAVFHTGMDTE